MPTTGLKKRGDIWHIDKTVNVGGQRVSIRESTGCRTEKDAKTILNRRVNEVRAQLLNGTPTVERTFAEAAAEYVADLERRGKDSTRCLQDVKMLLPVIGNLALSHIHQRTLQHWIDAQRGVRSSGTVGRALRTTSTILNFAARVLRDGNTPWLAIAPPRIMLPDWGERKPRPITWEEQDNLIALLPQHLIAPVLFALYTGARQAEITSLTWAQHRPQIGLPEFAAFWIPPEVRKGNSKKTASQQEGRYIVCNRAARSVIAQLPQDNEYVFQTVRGDGRMYRVNNHGWRSACRAAGLTIRFHDMRHTFGLRAADAGIPLDVRRSLLGHNHSDITLHYSSPGLVRLLVEVEKIERPISVFAQKRAQCELSS